MGLFSKFPYTNFQQLNLDWILEKIAYIDDKLSKTYDIPVASKTQFGRVKVGNNITVDEGVISVPKASSLTLGLVRVGKNLYLDEDGTLNAVGGTSGDTVTVMPTLNEGEEIAKIKVNENLYTLFSPKLPELTSSYTPYIDTNTKPTTTVYIDYANGDDNVGDGTIDNPLKTLNNFFNVYMLDKARQNHQYNVIIKRYNATYSLAAGGTNEEPLLIDYDVNIKYESYGYASSSVTTLDLSFINVAGSLTFGTLAAQASETGDGVSHKINLSNVNILETGTLAISVNGFSTKTGNSGTLVNVTNYGTICFGASGELSGDGPKLNLSLTNSIDMRANSKCYCNNAVLIPASGTTAIFNCLLGGNYSIMQVPLIVLNHFGSGLSSYVLCDGDSLLFTNDITSGHTNRYHTTYTLQ